MRRPPEPVRCQCECGEEWDDTIIHEHDTGASYLDRHEECPACGSADITTDLLDEIDIAERKGWI